MKDRLEMEGHEYIAAKLVLAKYGISATTLVTWVRNGWLPPCVRLGRARYFRADQIDGHLATRTEGAEP